MCGIAGTAVNPKGTAKPDRTEPLRAALHSLQHRGPDGRGEWHDNVVHLGHTRLAIIDLTPAGQQPLVSHCNRYVITFNGELYNYRALRDALHSQGFEFRTASDTEVLLAAYMAWGERCLIRFVGMFAFTIWDRDLQRLFVARDRFGEKPLYFHFSDNIFAFASEAPALQKIIGTDAPAFNVDAIDAYMHYGFVPEWTSLLPNIVKLAPATSLTLSVDLWSLRQEKYFELPQHETVLQAPPRDNWQSDLLRALREAVARSLESDVPVAIALSGGIDSSAVAALAAQSKPSSSLCTISVGYPNRPPYDERSQASELSRALGIEFHDVEVDLDYFEEHFVPVVQALSEPVADIAAVAHAAVPSVAKSLGCKVLLTGAGGDEVFWGYPWVQAFAKSEMLRQQFPRVHKLLGGALIGNALSPLAKAADVRLLPQALQALLRTSAAAHRAQSSSCPRLWDEQALFVSANRLRSQIYGAKMRASRSTEAASHSGRHTKFGHQPEYLAMKELHDTWLVSNVLALNDGVGMKVGIEARSPLLDHELVDVALAIQRQGNMVFKAPKYALKSALVPVLPQSVLRRKKRGFQPPTRAWMHNAVKRHESALFESALMRDGYFSADGVSKLLESALTNSQDLAYCYRLIVLAVWAVQFTQGPNRTT